MRQGGIAKLAIIGGACVALALPASAGAASIDLGISQQPSATIVNAGDTVTIKVTVSNAGGETYEQVFASLDSLKSHGKGADDPYLSVSASQGSCKDTSGPAYGYFYNVIVCELGALASGASAQITATVKINETAIHTASLLPNAYEGGFNDDNNGNNQAYSRITASTPPTISGSKKIKLKGIPAGCVPGDFTLKASTKTPGVKKMSAKLDLGFDAEGEGHEWRKVVRGARLVAKVPVSQITADTFDAVYTLKVKAKRGARGPLEAIVNFQLC